MIFNPIARAFFIITAMLDGLEGVHGFSLNPRTVATCRRKVRTSLQHQNDDNQDMNAPYVIYPDKKAWAWEKPSPKKSLITDLDQKNPAPAWLLNIIELAHWVSFPIAFCIASFLFNNASAIAEAGNWSGSTSQVFFIMLGILNQVFGGGNATLMHVYEGWMIAPFKNLLVLPENPTKEQVDAVRVQNYNNASLRVAAYQMLMTFISLGFSLFTMGVFGVKPWTQSLVCGTALISLLGPKEPRLELTRKVDGEDRPIVPLSISLLVLLIVNGILQFMACVKLFYPIFAQSGKLGTAVAVIASILPSALQTVGGLSEGVFAESSFKQWQHLATFSVLLAGFLLLGYDFKQMVLIGSTPDVMLPSFLSIIDSL